jgi:hypothetical protein
MRPVKNGYKTKASYINFLYYLLFQTYLRVFYKVKDSFSGLVFDFDFRIHSNLKIKFGSFLLNIIETELTCG